MAQSLIPEPVQSYEDSNGKPLNGGKLYTYAAGTLTAKATYQDSAGAIPNSNPIILSERGEATVYGTGNYRMILQNSLGAVIFDRDNVTAPTPSTSLAGPDGASQVGYDDTTLDVQIKDRLNRVVNSIAALRGLNKTLYTRAWVTGYYAAGDGGGGAYYYDSADTSTADNGGTVIVATDGGRWKLEYYGVLSVRQFGAKGDGTTDDTAAIQATVNAFTFRGGKIFVPPGEYGISGSGVTLPETIPTTDFNGMVFEGAGHGVVLKKLSGAGSILNILAARCTVRSITFNANSVADGCIFMDTDFDGLTTLIENCAFSSTTASGRAIFNNAGDSYMIRNNYFLSCGNWAYESTQNSINSTFSSNFVQGSGGVRLANTASTQAEGFRMIDNTILASGTSSVGIRIEFGLEIAVIGNIFDQGTGDSIQLLNNTSLVKATNNWISPTASGQGVNITQNVNSCTFIGNTFNGGTLQFSIGATNVGDIHSIQIFDNIFNNGSSAAIQMSKATRCLVQGNITTNAVGNSFAEAGGSNIQAANNIFKVAPSVSGGVTLLNNIIA